VLEEMAELIKEELNVKSVLFRENEEDLVEYRAKPNFRVLGKRLGKDMKAAAARIQELGPAEITVLLSGRPVSLELDGKSLEIAPDGVEIERLEKENLKVINEGSLTVALDPRLTEELVDEGIVRDLVRGVQNLRKEMGLEVTDRIDLSVHGSEALKKAVERFQEHLKAETLAVSWSWRKSDAPKEIECGEETCSVSVSKATGGR
jgi:isoleucyl-tRNA synthetase